MPIIIECKCGKRYQIDEAAAPCVVTCPSCQGQMTVADPAKHGPSPRGPAAEKIPGPASQTDYCQSARTSLILGLGGLLMLPLSIPAVIFGHRAISRIRRASPTLRGEGAAIGGLVLGYVGVVVMAMLLVGGIVAIVARVHDNWPGSSSATGSSTGSGVVYLSVTDANGTTWELGNPTIDYTRYDEVYTMDYESDGLRCESSDTEFTTVRWERIQSVDIAPASELRGDSDRWPQQVLYATVHLEGGETMRTALRQDSYRGLAGESPRGETSIRLSDVRHIAVVDAPVGYIPRSRKERNAAILDITDRRGNVTRVKHARVDYGWQDGRNWYTNIPRGIELREGVARLTLLWCAMEKLTLTATPKLRADVTFADGTTETYHISTTRLEAQTDLGNYVISLADVATIAIVTE